MSKKLQKDLTEINLVKLIKKNFKSEGKTHFTGLDLVERLNKKGCSVRQQRRTLESLKK